MTEKRDDQGWQGNPAFFGTLNEAERHEAFLWVHASVAVAFMKAHQISPVDYIRAYCRDRKALIRRFEAFRLDPANQEAIFAARHEAAELIGRGETKH